MSAVILDASALLALMRNEQGAEVVKTAASGALISAVNLGEAAQRQFRAGSSREDFEIWVDALGLEIVAVDSGLAIDAAAIREASRKLGLSQADCICIATAGRLDLPVLTADRAWVSFAETAGVEVRLIR